MTSKANQAASRVTTTESSAFDGYSGLVDVLSYHRSWWRRLLRLKAKPRTVRCYGDFRRGSVRLWRNEIAKRPRFRGRFRRM